MQVNPQQRADFLSAEYGPAHARVRLCPSARRPAQAPAWVARQRGWGSGWAIVTAWNPHGKQQGARANAEAEAQLEREASRRALPFQRVTNGSGEWAEPALLLRCTLAKAAALGRQFGQAAVVWGVGRRAALVWLGAGGTVRVERHWAYSAPSNTPTKNSAEAEA